MDQTKKTIFLLVSLFYTLYILFPLFADVVNIPVWLPSLVSSAIMMVLYPQTLKNKVVTWFIVYAIVLALFVLIGKPLTIGIGTVEDNKKILIEYAYILPTLCMFSVFCYLKDYKLTKKYVMWASIILYASFLVALPLMNQYNSWREALAEQGENVVIPGLPGYSLMHAYTLFLPAVCFAHKYSKGTLIFVYLLSVLLLCYVIYGTFVTTSLLIMIGILLFAYTYDDSRTSRYWITIFIAALLFFLAYKMGLFISLIDLISPLFEDTAVAPKLEDFKNSMLGGGLQGESITIRQDLHSKSLNSFLQSPLWGTSIVGGHSSLLDRFGGMGLLGGLPFLMIFVSFYKIFIKTLSTKRARHFFLMGLISGFIYVFEKGNWGAESWLMLMVMMPMALWVLENQDKRQLNQISKIIHS